MVGRKTILIVRQALCFGILIGNVTKFRSIKKLAKCERYQELKGARETFSSRKKGGERQKLHRHSDLQKISRSEMSI